jgi:antitoxin component of MazEF toxin-antitoxin module
MVTTFEKHGDRYLVEVDKSILEQLKIEPGTPVELTLVGRRLILSAADGNGDEDEFTKALREINQEFGDVLRNLAK